MSAYWIGRVAIQFFYFDRTDAPSGPAVRLAEIALVALFVYLAVVYGAAVAYNLAAGGRRRPPRPRRPGGLADHRAAVSGGGGEPWCRMVVDAL